MDKSDASLLRGIRAFAIAAGITFLLELPLTSSSSAAVIAFFCPWIVWDYGSTPLILVTVACRIGLLAGFLAWLNHKLGENRRMIAELKTQIRTLEEKLNNTAKD